MFLLILNKQRGHQLNRHQVDQNQSHHFQVVYYSIPWE